MFPLLFSHTAPSERDCVLAKMRECLLIVEQWGPENVLALEAHLATNWILHIDRYGQGEDFAKLPRRRQYAIIDRYAAAAHAMLADWHAAGCRPDIDAAGMWLATQMMTCYFVAIYIDDRELEDELSRQLDKWVSGGWSIAASAMPTRTAYDPDAPLLFSRSVSG